jgi:hypothetical protein
LRNTLQNSSNWRSASVHALYAINEAVFRLVDRFQLLTSRTPAITLHNVDVDQSRESKGSRDGVFT